MSNNLQQKRLVVAKVVGFHGLHGFVKVKLYCESIDNLIAMKMLWPSEALPEEDSKQNAAPLTIEKAKYQGQSVVVKFKELHDRTAAETLGKVFLSVPADSLPKLSIDEYYWHQLIGLKVMNADGLLGVVDHLLETGSNDVLVVRPSDESLDDKERLLPYRPEVITLVDLGGGMIQADWESDF
ncbi:MAG: ribosome maturation factor RimM [Cellvibrionales bacterium]|nr:ribosome maturation factor RimM [Cellvibrionales bacterium]